MMAYANNMEGWILEHLQRVGLGRKAHNPRSSGDETP
jgi:hypothetical protein